MEQDQAFARLGIFKRDAAGKARLILGDDAHRIMRGQSRFVGTAQGGEIGWVEPGDTVSHCAILLVASGI